MILKILLKYPFKIGYLLVCYIITIENVTSFFLETGIHQTHQQNILKRFNEQNTAELRTVEKLCGGRAE